MKDLLKITALFVISSGAFSAFTACTGQTGNQAANQSNTTVGNTNAATNTNAPNDAAKTEYPPLPPAVTQASLEAPDGKTFRLDDYRGKVVLVNLWATWCGPCRAEMPELVRMQDEHRAKGFEVIGLNTDREGGDDAAKVTAFAESMGLNYQLGWVDEKVDWELLKISRYDAIPQSFLIDREGTLLKIFRGASRKTINEMKEAVGKAVAE